MRRGARLALLCAGALAACGRYGPPVRSSGVESAPPAATRPATPTTARPAAPDAPAPDTSAQEPP